MAVKDWFTDDTLNTTLEGIPAGEGVTTFASLNDLFRKVCAAIKTFYASTWRLTGTDKNVTIQASGGIAPSSPNEGDLFSEY